MCINVPVFGRIKNNNHNSEYKGNSDAQERKAKVCFHNNLLLKLRTDEKLNTVNHRLECYKVASRMIANLLSLQILKDNHH